MPKEKPNLDNLLISFKKLSKTSLITPKKKNSDQLNNLTPRLKNILPNITMGKSS